MKKCLLSILLATVLLCACAQQTDNTLQTPESSTLVELTVATEETAIETPAPLATESPAPAPTQTPEPTATPAPTEIPIPEPTAAPTEAPSTESVAAESQPVQVSMSYGAVPFDLAAGSEEWWSIDSSDSAYWAVQENINATLLHLLGGKEILRRYACAEMLNNSIHCAVRIPLCIAHLCFFQPGQIIINPFQQLCHSVHNLVSTP